jgi:hypothetical protein
VAPHVDLQVSLVAVGARAHVTHVQVLLLHAMECKLLDRVIRLVSPIKLDASYKDSMPELR